MLSSSLPKHTSQNPLNRVWSCFQGRQAAQREQIREEMSGVIDVGCCSCWFPVRMGLSYRGVVTLPVHSQNFLHVPEGRQWTCAPKSACKAHLERQELPYVYKIEIPHLSRVSPLRGVADVPAAKDMLYQIFEYHDCLVDCMEGINYWTVCKDLVNCKTHRKLEHSD